ncbi:hypothetical protein R7D96_13135 [Vibrio sp. Vb2853]|uniref:hypothetical protein n=1 Tax=unclassified Vibrio TaxID=2614977 RepID=UPI0029641B3F|nr:MULTISPECIES: hypothetical protein [unclassified Vibrio]MDW1615071.1 hypothetical protein [Vibrio sp. Vb2881]MDW1619787.1 hypothetical protein [Vibrio sp. Vb2864]MDW1691921.1 hypothetical protein [Vibrio sp. Vb2853]MDW1710631.1 hypothetical protein [Vibrio sp. Vb2865]MDW1715752.1 hypothetical protein [Vibrio sp. Vb2873]
MNAFLAGIGKALAIWPRTDYEQFIPQVRPTTEAWYKTQAMVHENWVKIETNHPEIKRVKLYRRSISREPINSEGNIEYAEKPQR